MKSVLLSVLLSFFAISGVLAEPPASIEITDAWARATPPTAVNGAVYLKIVNTGTADDRLVDAASDISERTELHESLNDNGVMIMRPLVSVAVPAGAMLEFAPGGKHVMLFGLNKPLTVGDTFGLTLKFEKAGEIKVTVKVADMGTKAPAMPMSGGDMNGMDMGGMSMDHMHQ